MSPKSFIKESCLSSAEFCCWCWSAELDIVQFPCGHTLCCISTGGCYDKHPDCEDWASNHECHNNPYAMLTTCPKACEVDCDPCKDHVWYCSDLTEHCHTNPYATIMNCPKTCGVC
ncbi:hypothetical protein ACROYT_G020879 [Oculina patagonica]